MEVGNLDAVIVAGGGSQRMGFDKLTAALAGVPLIQHSLAAFNACPVVNRIILVCPADRQDEFATLAAPFSKVIRVVPGGSERLKSVLAGVVAFPAPRPSAVAIHDGARPLITPEAIADCYAAAEKFGAAVCAEPATDSLHRADAEGLTVETVSRENLWRMQTPQIIEYETIRHLLEQAQAEDVLTTDEIALLVRAGGKAAIVENRDWNFKITYPRDFELASMILEQRSL